MATLLFYGVHYARRARPIGRSWEPRCTPCFRFADREALRAGRELGAHMSAGTLNIHAQGSRAHTFSTLSRTAGRLGSRAWSRGRSHGIAAAAARRASRAQTTRDAARLVSFTLDGSKP